MKKLLTSILILGLLVAVCGCSENGILQPPTANDTTPSGTDPTVAPTAPVEPAQDSDMFSDKDLATPYDPDESVTITLNGDSISCTSPRVDISGTTAAITGEGTFILTGTLNDGSIIVNADSGDKPHIILDGAHITSATSAPLYIKEAKKVFVTLADGSENSLISGSSFAADGDITVNAALYSRQDLSINGTGKLAVTSPAGHGISSKDDLIIAGGEYTIQCANHGLDANDSIRITSATMTIDAGKDGIHAENVDDATQGFLYLSGGALTLTAQGDGISAGAYGEITGGTVSITAGGGSVNGESHSSGNYGGFPGGGGGMRPRTATATDTDSTSMKGIKATGYLLISGGSFTIDSADDALHSNADLTISGGTFDMSSGDDGIHSDATLSIYGGTVSIKKCYEGLEALHVIIAGGDIDLKATDDGINAAGGNDESGGGGRDDGMMPGRPGGGGMSGNSSGSVVISGGELYINSSGDGIDANGTLTISGGYTVVVGPTQGDTATLDYDVSGIITGGTFIGTGASGMAQTFSSSENQGVYAVSVGNQSAGTEITLEDMDGNVIISYSPELSFGVVILSSPEIQSSITYKITVGSTSGEFEAS